MLEDVIAYLACPHCAGELALVGQAARCAAGHTFDVARQGYVSLLSGEARTQTADPAAMVAARSAFLAAGHYDPIADAVADEAERVCPASAAGCVVDLGAGTGHHLARVLARLPDRAGLALDLSKHALRRAARAHPRLGAVACDAWRSLPVRSGAAAVALSAFAPRNGEELHRVLAPDGALVVVTPAPAHLTELVDRLGLLTVDERKDERLEEKLARHFEQVRVSELRRSMSLDRVDVERLVEMGPSAHHVDASALAERLDELPSPMSVTASVRVGTYRRR